MDELDLLAGDDELPLGEISQEDEDALLLSTVEVDNSVASTSDVSTPTTTPTVTPTATPTSGTPPVDEEKAPVDPEPMEVTPAEPTHEDTTHTDDDSFMLNEDSESNEASEDKREVDDTHSDETSVGSSQSQCASATCSLNGGYVRSMFQAVIARQSKQDDSRAQSMANQISKVIEISETQRRDLRQIAGMKEELKKMENMHSSLQRNFDQTISIKERQALQPMRIPTTSDSATPSSSKTIILDRTTVENTATVTPIALVGQQVPSIGSAPGPNGMAGRQSARTALRQQRQQVAASPRRMSTGNVQQQFAMQQQQRQQQQTSRVSSTSSVGLPSMQHPQRPQPLHAIRQNVATPPQPLPAPPPRMQLMNGQRPPAAILQNGSAHQQRQQQLMQHQRRQQQQAPSNHPNGHVHNGAAAGPSGAAAAVNGVSPGILAAQRSQHMHNNNRKRPHSFPDEPQDQKPQPQDLSLQQLQQLQRTAPQVYALQMQLSRMQQAKEEEMANPRAPLTQQPRLMDPAFTVPAVTDKRKMEANVPAFNLSRPSKRPSEQLPINAQYSVGGPHAPKISLTTSHADFVVSGKVSGKISFTPPADWPENTARICIFYFIGTQNSGQWAHSDFATVDVDLNNLKEVSAKFVISMGKWYLSPDVSKKPSGIIRTEIIGIVAVACAGTTLIRGDEAAFDYECLEFASRELKIAQLSQRLALTQQNQRGAMNAVTGGAPRPLPRHPGAGGGGADDDIVDVTMQYAQNLPF